MTGSFASSFLSIVEYSDRSVKMVPVTILFFVFATIAAQPIDESKIDDAKESIWKGTPMDTLLQEYRDECSQHTEGSACMKLKVLNFVDEFLSKDTFKLVPNENKAKDTRTGRSDDSFLEQVENYVKSHDIVVAAPSGFLRGATFKLSPRNLDENELNMSVKLPSEDENVVSENRGRKSKLRKILVPILVFVLLKAMTLIPLAIGVLGLKAWNALQLSFISFLVSISLAIFQLCKKVAADSGSQIAAHIPFETSHYAARNFVVSPQENDIVDRKGDVNAQDLAYRAYIENS